MRIVSKSLLRRMFYRSRIWRLAIGLVSTLTGRTSWLGATHLLSYTDKNAIGPLQRDEALALFGIVRTLCPETIVEFGFYQGHSAFNFLCALEPDARIYSYDISDDSLKCSKNEFALDKRFSFVHKSQASFEPSDIDHRPIDLAFFDAAHDLLLNIETFRRILPHVTSTGMVVVHDTGLWNKSFFGAVHNDLARKAPAGWVTETAYAHQPDERSFINWILREYKEIGALHFHSNRKLRHGFTILQRQTLLTNRAPSCEQDNGNR